MDGCWLKGQQTAKQAKILRKPVEYYVLGAGRWKTADSWPPSPRRMRLHLAAGDSTSGAQGALTTAAEDGGKQRYLYVPGVGTPGALDGLPGASTDKHAIPATALTYATKPLAHDTEVSGDPRLQLSAATTATDADWLVSLIDIVPDGKVQASDNRVGNWVHVTAGQLRASHWRGDSHLEPVPANKAVDYTITLRPTSYLFKKGHRIALQIASADLTHSAGTPIPAINTVFHTSALTLPIGR